MIPIGSLALVGLGMLILVLALRPLPGSEAGSLGSESWHLATHPAGAIIVPGLALHPGPASETLAAALSPVAGPALIVAVALPPLPEATPLNALVADADESIRNP
ncbi:MAG: hypothetical protein M3464_19465 [Chloroflexota bacterium]|nr:hypothetical protein [Chloroflexota bacterium]